jgi:putative transposase
MPRRNRCVLPDVPCHITQRGVDRCPTFASFQDRSTYLRLLAENLADAEVSILGYCLMTNHVHLVFRRVHGRYSQYFNTRSGRTGETRDILICVDFS